VFAYGIIGLPNAGKSTLFNALTRGTAAVAPYPFCTIEPNLGEVAIPDPRLEAIAKQHRCVRAPRGKGLMLAADFVHSETDQPDPALRDRVVEEAFARGLLLLGCGETSIRFTPPLCIDRAQLEKGFDVLAEAVTAAEK